MQPLSPLAAAAALLVAATANAQSTLEQEIQQRMDAAHIPGLGASVVRGGRIVWSGSFGHADLAGDRPAGEETIWSWGSIGKSVTATAALQLWDRGLLQLDADVDDDVAFALRHPSSPAAPITMHGLLSHTGGLAGDTDIIWGDLAVVGDWPLPLEAFLTHYLDPSGRVYRDGAAYTPWAPGEGYEYSNVGYTLAAHVVERLSGTSFDEYCRREVFDLLGMQDTDWRLAHIDQERLATGYVWDPVAERNFPLPAYSSPVWPAGMLRAPVRDMARFLMAHLGRGEFRGARLLSPAAVDRMHSVHAAGAELPYGYGFVVYEGALNGHDLVWHDGGAAGLSAHMILVPSLELGVLVACNGSDEQRLSLQAALDVALMLLAQARTL